MRSRQGLVGVLLSAVAATALPPSAVAQEDEIEEVVVTGSRIQRDPNTIAAQPVQSLSAEDIQLSGEFSITDVINDVPALFSSTTSENSIDSAFADGANILDLRGLGANRTLVLVDGRRHVAGNSGTAAVDVGSIPLQLIERVEVLTGGASAVYGADAVTGVVNFILKDDYEGFEINATRGISGEWDGDQSTISAIWGKNFANDRANITLAVDYRRDEGLRANERDGAALIGSGRDWTNPAKRFQQGDIDPSTMPNFAQYYNFANTGLTDFGLPVPTADGFISDFNGAFGADPVLTGAEQAFIAAAAAAPERAVLPGRTFPFTSGYGYIIPGNPFTFAGFAPAPAIDLDANGRPDCLDSFTGYNSVFGAASFGVVGGCWNVTENGSYRPVQDGLVSGSFQGFGGDSFNTIQQNDGWVILPDEKITLNLVGRYDVTDTMTFFGEVKYSTQETENDGQPSSFWDLLFGAPDNPFLPDFIQPIADANGGVAITIDPIGLGDAQVRTERDTVRFVGGIEGEFSNGWSYEVSANYGQYKESIFNSHALINDRFLASIDAVTDPATGRPACRSSVDPTAPATTTPFNIPAYDPGYFSFTPGDGSCIPLNIWAGEPGIRQTQQAVDWVTRATTTEVTIDQTVFGGFIVGDSSDWFELPDGAIDFVAGFEWREETSEQLFDPFARGILPAGSPFGGGTLLSDVSGNSNLLFRPALANANEVGEYDVADVFFEASAPLLVGRKFAEELTVDAAVRFADYSTIGDATTWKTSISYAPVSDIRFRATLSEAVRAPNITELFAPTTGITSRPNDPSDAAQINAIAADNPTLAAQTQANCVADLQAIGLDPFDGNGVYNFADPLSAAFGGVQSGNANLDEEVADTITVGFITQPRFLEGFTFSIDYWEISIEDAIASVSDQDIVNACYNGTSLNDAFCTLFTRNNDPNSLQFGGFNSIQRSLVNFARLDTRGFDFSADYKFNLGEHDFNVNVSGTKVHQLDRFSDPQDLSVVDVELGEVRRPEWAGNVFLNWFYNGWNVGIQSQYQGEQLLRFVEIDTAQSLYGDDVFQDAFWQHDLSVSFDYSDQLRLYGGIRNFTDEEPFITDFAYPASPRGRFLFIGANYLVE